MIRRGSTNTRTDRKWPARPLLLTINTYIILFWCGLFAGGTAILLLDVSSLSPMAFFGVVQGTLLDLVLGILVICSVFLRSRAATVATSVTFLALAVKALLVVVITPIEDFLDDRAVGLGSQVRFVLVGLGFV